MMNLYFATKQNIGCEVENDKTLDLESGQI